jgi:hypothetical protein
MLVRRFASRLAQDVAADRLSVLRIWDSVPSCTAKSLHLMGHLLHTMQRANNVNEAANWR